MQNYRKLIIHVDSNTGELIDEFYERIVRDNSLPKFLLADTVIAEFHFWEKLKLNGIEEWQQKIFSSGSEFRIIGDIDNDLESSVILHSLSSSEYSDFSQGVVSFLINTNSLVFANALNNKQNLKGVLVVYGINSENIEEYFVLAKGNFIAENRPCEVLNLKDEDYLDFFTKEEIQLILDGKAGKGEISEFKEDTNARLDSLENTLGNLTVQLDTTLNEVQ